MNTWTYRGHRLRFVEWGLWRDLDRPGTYFLCYRPQGRGGPCVRKWARVSRAFPLDDLRTHVRRIRAQIQARKLKAAVRLPLDLAVRQYIAELKRRGRSAGHVTDVEAALERFAAESGDLALDGVDVRLIEQFLASLRASPRTQNKYRAHISALLTWAMRRGMVDSNPCRSVAAAKEVRALPRFPSVDEMTRMVQSAPLRTVRLLTFLAFTGIRRGSFLSLVPASFRADGIIVPHTKEGRERFLSYSDGCPLWGVDLSSVGLAIWREGVPTEYELRQASEAAWDYTLHSLRHAFCSWLAAAGENMSDVAAWAGHSTVTTTERWYAHLRPRGQARLAKNRADVLTLCSHALRRCLDDVAVSSFSA